MNSYFMTASDLKKLYGQKFKLKNQQGEEARFRIPPPGDGWPRSGLEAYGLLVECEHSSRGLVPSFLKVFRLDLPNRSERTAYLIRLGLAKHHPWLFQGMPYVAMKHFSINGVKVVGHIAQQIRGLNGTAAEDFSRLRSLDDWKASPEERTRVAGHLCCSVAALEKLSLVHGDLSARNVMIGGAQDGKIAAILCDFDGFYQPAQLMLPLEYNHTPCRPMGSPGYQYPHLLQELANGASDPSVRTDRFALAVLVCELMVWDAAVARDVDREELLSDEIIRKRDLALLPTQVRRKWKDGFDLLQAALATKDPGDFPSPEIWLELLLGKRFIGRPQVKVYRRKGRRELLREVRLGSDQGDFSPAHPTLADIKFRVSPTTSGFECALEIKWSFPVLLRRRGGRLQDAGKGPVIVAVQPGDLVNSNQWEFEILDSAKP